MNEYLLTGAIKDAASLIAQAIERHGQHMVKAAKIEANSRAEAAGNKPVYMDTGERSPLNRYRSVL